MGIYENIRAQEAWKGPGISDGKDLERGLLGEPHTSPEKSLEYLSYREALVQAKERQPSILNRHPTINKLRTRIAELCGNTKDPVKFYTAIGTSLDIHHGVDAFFEQGNVTVTLDVSAQEKELYKADVLMHATLTDEGKIVIKQQEIERVAVLIARAFDMQNQMRTHKQ